MHRNRSSLTAAGIAIARANESEKPPGERICYDPYARQFVPPWMNRFLGFFIFPVDFNTQLLSERLLSSGFNPALVSLFVWQGFTMYLSPAGGDSTLSFVLDNADPGSSIVFDYVYQSVLDGHQKQSEISSTRNFRGNLHEKQESVLRIFSPGALSAKHCPFQA